MSITEADKFMAKVAQEPMSGCWLWTGPLWARDRYGVWPTSPGHSEAAHRTSYRLFKGPIPLGLVIDHLCSVTGCVNPAHLEAVTQKENNRRRRNSQAMQTSCVNGHPFTPENTRTVTAKKGLKRACKECDRQRHQTMRARRRSLAL